MHSTLKPHSSKKERKKMYGMVLLICVAALYLNLGAPGFTASDSEYGETVLILTKTLGNMAVLLGLFNVCFGLIDNYTLKKVERRVLVMDIQQNRIMVQRTDNKKCFIQQGEFSTDTHLLKDVNVFTETVKAILEESKSDNERLKPLVFLQIDPEFTEIEIEAFRKLIVTAGAMGVIDDNRRMTFKDVQTFFSAYPISDGMVNA